MTAPGDATRHRLGAGLFASAQQARLHLTDPRRLKATITAVAATPATTKRDRKSSGRLSNSSRRLIIAARQHVPDLEHALSRAIAFQKSASSRVR
jgi:hypothetical protein